MKSPTDEIALQGIEFWSTVCDEEADLAIEAVEVRGGGLREGVRGDDWGEEGEESYIEEKEEGGGMVLCKVTVLSVELQAQEQGRPPEQISRFYVKGAMQYLVPILLMTLAKQVIISHTLSPTLCRLYQPLPFLSGESLGAGANPVCSLLPSHTL